MTPALRIVPPGWVAATTTQSLLRALAGAGIEARFVGGCVRDTLLGRAIGDIDVATPAAPDRVSAVLAAAGIRVVPTGIAHGTVTAIVPPGHFEITTLRRDVETFGRHARVEYDADWREDAARRDFTMNALFLSAAGDVWDFFGGLADLRAGCVRFVGEPEQRIREDVLRLLRFYRFHAWFGRGEPDAATRDACRRLAPLLPTLSAERVAAELLRLLGAPDPVPTVALMRDDGILQVLLPEAGEGALLAALVAIESETDAVRRLAALLPARAEVAESVARRLRFSNEQGERLAALASPPVQVDPAAEERAQRLALYHLGAPLFRDLILLAAARAGNGLPRKPLDLAARWVAPRFPLGGADAAALGIEAGPRMGALLAAVREWWAAEDFRPDRQACLARLAALAGAGPA